MNEQPDNIEQSDYDLYIYVCNSLIAELEILAYLADYQGYQMNISKYEQQGFEGVDADLEISLCEYGLIWKEYKYNLKKRGVVKGEILAVSYNEVTNSTDYGYYRKDELLSETWIDWEAISSYTGMKYCDIAMLPAGQLLYNLISYYGKQEFGLN